MKIAGAHRRADNACPAGAAIVKDRLARVDSRSSWTAARTRLSEVVPMAGLEPARLAPPPPQDGVSTNSTTSARTERLRVTLSIRISKLRDPELFARRGLITPEVAAEMRRWEHGGVSCDATVRIEATDRKRSGKAGAKGGPLDVPRMQRLLRYCARPILGRASGLGTAARAPGTATSPACRAEDAASDRSARQASTGRADGAASHAHGVPTQIFSIPSLWKGEG
jgi:hypothetical protein